jgi:hypothetical protein
LSRATDVEQGPEPGGTLAGTRPGSNGPIAWSMRLWITSVKVPAESERQATLGQDANKVRSYEIGGNR